MMWQRTNQIESFVVAVLFKNPNRTTTKNPPLNVPLLGSLDITHLLLESAQTKSDRLPRHNGTFVFYAREDPGRIPAYSRGVLPVNCFFQDRNETIWTTRVDVQVLPWGRHEGFAEVGIGKWKGSMFDEKTTAITHNQSTASGSTKLVLKDL